MDKSCITGIVLLLAAMLFTIEAAGCLQATVNPKFKKLIECCMYCSVKTLWQTAQPQVDL